MLLIFGSFVSTAKTIDSMLTSTLISVLLMLFFVVIHFTVLSNKKTVYSSVSTTSIARSFNPEMCPNISECLP